MVGIAAALILQIRMHRPRHELGQVVVEVAAHHLEVAVVEIQAEMCRVHCFEQPHHPFR